MDYKIPSPPTLTADIFSIYLFTLVWQNKSFVRSGNLILFLRSEVSKQIQFCYSLEGLTNGIPGNHRSPDAQF